MDVVAIMAGPKCLFLLSHFAASSLNLHGVHTGLSVQKDTGGPSHFNPRGGDTDFALKCVVNSIIFFTLQD